MIALLVMTDGRSEYIHKTIESASLMLDGPITEYWMHDDSGDEGVRQRLHCQFPGFTHIGQGLRRGFGGAYDFAWKTLASRSECDYIFNLEDDFTFNRQIPLNDMIHILEENPNVYQMALKRQPWSSEEIQAGGFMERWSEAFHQQDGWISHRLFFTTNPSLYRLSLAETKTYPNVKDSEGHFSMSILEFDPDALFGYWGQKTDEPWVTHTGVHRKANIY